MPTISNEEARLVWDVFCDLVDIFDDLCDRDDVYICIRCKNLYKAEDVLKRMISGTQEQTQGK